MRYAAVVSSSFLSVRSTTSSAANGVIKAVARSMAITAVKVNDGSMQCCCRKGKCRERPELSSHEHHGELNRCTFHKYERTSGNKSMPFHCHGHLRRVRRVFTNMITHNDVFRTSPSYTMFSRSVASAASIPKRQTATLSSRRPGAQNSRLVDFRDRNFLQSHSELRGLWEAFSALINEGDAGLLDVRELVTLGGMITRNTEVKEEVMTNSREWGDRLEHVVLELRRRSPVRLSAETLQLKCLAIVSQALRGRCDDAAVALSAVLRNERSSPEHFHWILHSCKHVLMSLLRHGSPSQSIDFYLNNYIHLKQLLSEGHGQEHSVTRIYALLFSELSAIFRAMDSPSSFLATKKSTWDKSRISSLGVTMLRVLCRDGLAEDALEVHTELKRQDIVIRYFVEHALVRALTRAQRFESANLLYVAIAPRVANEADTRSYESTGLHLFAHQGNVGRAEECFRRLSAEEGVTPQEMTLVMHASATRGDTDRVVGLFEEFFGKPDQGPVDSNLHKPNKYHYSTVINAYAVRDDVEGMNYWLGRMLADGLTPDHATYNIVLKGIAQRDDMKSVNSLLDQMRAARVSPNVNSYTTVITTLARRRDVLGAEAMFKRMIREHINFDRLAITTLMNAHVEAGSWKGVIRVFDFISESRLKDLRLGVEVFNTLLKAYVLIGAPLEIVMEIYHRLEMANMRPTNRTFALLIKSACDADRMDIASRLFVEMEALGKDWTTNVEVTKEVFTIIMSAYLRQGNRHQAKVIYEDMQKRAMQTTAYTYATILRSYSDIAFEENMHMAHEFLDSLASQPTQDRDWIQPASGRDSSYAFVYAPLINAHAKNLDVDMVERLYSEFVEHNERPTIGILALLMDAYRRRGDIEGVQRIWLQLVDHVMGRTDEVDLLLPANDTQSEFFRSRRRGDLLCIPLSIYIDALSHAGQHTEIAHTWNKLRDAGFQFDAHNWNHLVVALVRAGQPARAFEVVEKVILPYQRQSQSVLRTRLQKVDSPLVFDDEQARVEIEDEPFIAKVERSSQRRASLLTRMRRRFAGRAGKESGDLAHDLQLMQQISPEWNVWRPHTVTLQVLVGVLERLDSGRLIHPMKPKQGDGESDYSEEDLEDEVTLPEETAEARQLLDKILRDYPQTILTIDNWESYTAFEASKSNRRAVRRAKFELQDVQRVQG